jgi:hypothetical protein
LLRLTLSAPQPPPWHAAVEVLGGALVVLHLPVFLLHPPAGALALVRGLVALGGALSRRWARDDEVGDLPLVVQQVEGGERHAHPVVLLGVRIDMDRVRAWAKEGEARDFWDRRCDGRHGWGKGGGVSG